MKTGIPVLGFFVFLILYLVACIPIEDNNARNLFVLGEKDRRLEGEWLSSRDEGLIPADFKNDSPSWWMKVIFLSDNDSVILRTESSFAEAIENEFRASTIKIEGAQVEYLILVPTNANTYEGSLMIPYRFHNDNSVHVLGYGMETIIQEQNLPSKKAPPPSNISPFSSVSLGEVKHDDLRKLAKALRDTPPLYVFYRTKTDSANSPLSRE